MDKSIKLVAEKYAKLSSKIKLDQAKLSNYRDELLDYANNHNTDFNEDFQLEFPNGLFISQRMKSELSGSSNDKDELLSVIDDKYITKSLNDKLILEDASSNRSLMKLLTKFNISVKQKEILAVNTTRINK